MNQTRETVLVSGASGFLGRHLVEELGRSFRVRALDPSPCEGAETWIEGSVVDAGTVGSAVHGIDGLVIAHMAPNRPGVYDAVGLPFDVNVKGTALLLDAAADAGVKQVVLISSMGVIGRDRVNEGPLSADTPYSPDGLYGLTKCLQEQIARYYHERRGMNVTVLRPAYIVREDSLQDKYGRQCSSVNWQYIDPRDIASACCAAISLKVPGFEVLYVLGGPGAGERVDLQRSQSLLRWEPAHRFSMWPGDEA